MSDVRSAMFSADGTKVVTASDDGTTRIWRSDGQEPPLVLGLHGTDVRGAAFSSDGERVATGDANGVLRVWRLDDPTEAERVLRGAPSGN